MKFPPFIAFNHVDFTGYPHTAGIHLTACSVDDRLYMLFACSSNRLAFFDSRCGCHCPRCWINGMRYWPWSSLTPIRMGFPFIRMSTSCSLCTVTPLYVKMDIVPSSAVLPTLINECRNSVNVSAVLADVDNDSSGSCVANFALHVSPLATFTFLIDLCKIGRFVCVRSSLVM